MGSARRAHEEVIPASAFSSLATYVPGAGGLGLRVYWSSGVSHATTLGEVDWLTYDSVTTQSNVSWPISNNPVHRGRPTDYFAVRLVGLINVPTAGNWTFSLGSDAGARLFVNGNLVVNDDANHSFRFRDGTVALPSGNVRIEIRYLELNYSQGLVLTWRGPGGKVKRWFHQIRRPVRIPTNRWWIRAGAGSGRTGRAGSRTPRNSARWTGLLTIPQALCRR